MVKFSLILAAAGPWLVTATFPVQHDLLSQDIIDNSSKHQAIVTADSGIHRKLLGEDGIDCDAKDFACLPHSEPKREVSCHKDPVEDCECKLGFTRSSTGHCIAEEGLCSEEYFDSIFDTIDTVGFYVDRVYETRESDPDKSYGYYEKMEINLADAWSAYNRGRAACEVELGEDFLEDEDGSRRLLLRERRLFFKSIVKKVKKVAKAVVTVAKVAVETVVNVVTELVECGVGIATDGAKCGLIGCAFGLIGVGLDIAFTVATGGGNKASQAACSAVDIATGDATAKDGAKDSTLSLVVPILLGIGNTVCIVNTKFEDKTLGNVCNVFKKAERVNNGLIIAELIDPISFFFLDNFRTAMCGNPFSAIANLLEEVVSCFIGCAKDKNVFCPKKDDGNKAERPELPAPEDESPELPAPEDESSDELSVEYKGSLGKICQKSSSERGEEDLDFEVLSGLNLSECQSRCDERELCKGFESTRSNRCEIWTTVPVFVKQARPTRVARPGFSRIRKRIRGPKCFVKVIE